MAQSLSVRTAGETLARLVGQPDQTIILVMLA